MRFLLLITYRAGGEKIVNRWFINYSSFCSPNPTPFYSAGPAQYSLLVFLECQVVERIEIGTSRKQHGGSSAQTSPPA
jgi:hypothetical protein